MKTPLILLALVLFIVAAVVVGVLVLRPGVEPVTQPIQFNHKIHMDPKNDLKCTSCHSNADKGQHSTLPTIKQCLLCHTDPQGISPEEPKIREYAKQGKEIPWIQVNRVEGHVYFSHVAHVKYGKMQCTDCHNNHAENTKPVTQPDIGHLTMSACMECHEQHQVSNDCLTCHK